MAEDPERIEKLFTNSYYLDTGMFRLEMYNKGQREDVVVDDRLPVYPNPTGEEVDKMFNAQMSSDNAWWGPILEKVWCKMNIACAYTFSYPSSEKLMESLRALTGYPSEMFYLSKQNDEEFMEFAT